MNNFWSLVKFEYKKIFMKRSSIILISLYFLFITFFDLIPYFENFEQIKQDKQYFKENFEGKKLDENLIIEAVNSLKNVNSLFDESGEKLSEEFIKYALPYKEILKIITGSLEYNFYNEENFYRLKNMTLEDAKNFYNDIKEISVNKIKEKPFIDEKIKEKVVKLSNKIETPFILKYTEPYNDFFIFLFINNVFLLILIMILVSPIFSSEYVKGLDQIILSCKNGKKSLIWAKIFTCISLCILLPIIFITFFNIKYILMYNLDIWDAKIQLLQDLGGLFCYYPYSIGKMIILSFVSCITGILLNSTLSLFLSARLKNSFQVVSIMFLFEFVQIIMQNFQFFYKLEPIYKLLPFQMMTGFNLVEQYPYKIFDFVLEPFIFMPLVSIVISLILIPFTYTAFKNHKI